MTQVDPPNICVVRLSTSAYETKTGVHLRKSLLWQKRKSSGFQILKEDASMIGQLELYQVVTCNESKDWESGMLDDYDYKLIPFFSDKESI